MNLKEPMAVKECIFHFRSAVRGSLLNIRTDSMTVVHNTNRWCSRSEAIDILRDNFAWTLATGTTATATHMNTKSNLIADRL